MEMFEKKKSQFLDLLSEAEGSIRRWERLQGGGLFLKGKRLFAMPDIYLRYLWWKLPHTPRIHTAKTFWGQYMKLPLYDFDAFGISVFGMLEHLESPLARFLIKNFRDDDVFYDVGANIGFYTMLAKEFIRKGEIHAFEPFRRSFDLLRSNIEAKNCFLLNLALSDTEDTAILYVSKKRSGLNTLMPELMPHTLWDSFSKAKISCVNLDAYVEKYTPPTIIKIDVEGSEEKVLMGGATFFQTYQPIVCMEVRRDEKGKDISKAAMTFLLELGYRAYRIEENGNLILLRDRGSFKKNMPLAWGNNLVFQKC